MSNEVVQVKNHLALSRVSAPIPSATDGKVRLYAKSDGTLAYNANNTETVIGAGGGGGVTSVNGETGAVTLSADDVNAAAKLTPTGKTVYGHNEGGTYGLVGYNETPGAFTLVMRDFSGNFTVNAPTDDAHPATKLYVDSKATGVPTTSQSSRMYATDGSGGQTTLIYNDAYAESSTIARRTSTGAIFTGTPTDPDHATTKNYVDTAIASNTPGWQTAILQSDVPKTSTAFTSTGLSVPLPTEEVSTVFEYELYVYGEPTAGISVRLDGANFGSITTRATATGIDGSNNLQVKDVTLGTGLGFDLRQNVTKITISGYLDGLKEGQSLSLGLSVAQRTSQAMAIYLLAGSFVRYVNH